MNNMNTIISRYVPLIQSDDDLKTSFSTETFNVAYWGKTNLIYYIIELLSPSYYAFL